MAIINTLVLVGILLGGLVLAIAIIIIVVVVKANAKKTAQQTQNQYIPYTPPPPVEQKPLGEVIKHHRERCGLSQEFVAQQLDVSRQAVSKWESGTSAPSTANLIALAKLLGISADELIKDVG